MRKLIALTLASALSLGAVSPALAHGDKKQEHGKVRLEYQFKDWQNGYWANESLARMIARGVMKGDGDSTIASQRQVTRLEAAIMLARLLNLEAPQLPQGKFSIKAPWGELKIENERDEFELKLKTREGEFEIEDDGDIPAWGRDAILVGLSQGFLLFDGAHLSPMAPLNRLEAAIMLVKAAGLDEEAQARADAALTFTDMKQIPSRLRGYIAIAVEKGFVNGFDDGSFKPMKPLTRAEWAALLDRLDRKGPAVSPDGRQVKGLVTGLTEGDSPSLTMKTPVFPSGVTYQFDDSATLYAKGQPITVADLRVGDQVIINLGADRTILMVTVNNEIRQVKGTVLDFTLPAPETEGQLTLEVEGKESLYPVTAETAFLLGTSTVEAADLLVGDRVTLTLEGSRLAKVVIGTEARSVKGRLESVTEGGNSALPEIAITVDGTLVTYLVADSATITGGIEGLTLADLKVGEPITVKVERNLVTAITLGRAGESQSGKAFEVKGRLVSLDQAAGTLVLADYRGRQQRFRLADELKGEALSRLKVGDKVELVGRGELVYEVEIDD